MRDNIAIISLFYAEVVELVDTLAWGASEWNLVRVQVPPSAPKINYSIGISSDKPSSTASSIRGVSKITSEFSVLYK